MDGKTILSVCVAIYNIEERYLRACIESLISDKEERAEFLLGDDCSNRQTYDICKEYASRDPRVRHIRKEKNEGVSAIRNAMIEAANGEWITFIDGDDAVAKNYSSCLCAAVGSKRSPYDIIMYQWERFSGKIPHVTAANMPIAAVLPEASRAFSEACLTGAPPHTDSYGIDNSTPSSVCNKMYGRGFLLENKLFFTVGVKKSQDSLFNIRAYHACRNLGYLPQKLYLYRKNAASVTNRYSADFEDNIIRSCIKYDLINLKELFGNDPRVCAAWQKYKLIHYIINDFALNIFHKDNPNSAQQRRAGFIKFVRSDPFKTFFAEFDFSSYEWHERRIILSLAAKEKFGTLDFMYRHPLCFKLYGKIMSAVTQLTPIKTEI